MQILSGLFDHMILQRNGQNVSDTPVNGSCPGAGMVQLRLRSGGRTVRGLNWIKIGQAVGRKFTARLKGIPVGGPYDIDLRIVDRKKQILAEASVKDVLVGDLWMLGGQSNMEGCGTLTKYPKTDRTIRTFQMNHQWELAQHPIHRLDLSVDQVHTYLAGGVPYQMGGLACVGPGLSFARTMKKRTGIPQGLIPCAHGGSAMHQWDPSLKKFPNRSLYGASIRRAKLNGGRVAGILWYQGCNDAVDSEAKEYSGRMKKLVRAFRRDLNDPRLPFVAVQLSRYTPADVFPHAPWNDVQEQQRLLPRAFDRLVIVPTVDLELEDVIHLDGPSQQRLGRRLAQAALSLTQRPRQEKPPIELGIIKIKPQPVTAFAIIEITFKNVIGGFVSTGRPTGFSVSLDGTMALPVFHKTLLKRNRIILYTSIDRRVIGHYKVSYGLGLNPYCNITDQADRSLPVFGPIDFQLSRAVTPLIRQWRTSKVLPDAAKLGRLACPDTSNKKLRWRRREFLTAFADVHTEWQDLAGQDNHIVYACRFNCPEKMPLALWLGYDGPVKVWVDRKMVFHDPNGINPAEIDAKRIDLNAGKGGHEIVVALGSNCGLAWGVFLRIERPDISQRLLRKGPNAYTMPEILG